MHDELDRNYGIPFRSWSKKVQGELLAVWDDYLRPGGLRDVVFAWRADARGQR